jgi:hypothetical protein
MDSCSICPKIEEQMMQQDKKVKKNPKVKKKSEMPLSKKEIKLVVGGTPATPPITPPNLNLDTLLNDEKYPSS